MDYIYEYRRLTANGPLVYTDIERAVRSEFGYTHITYAGRGLDDANDPESDVDVFEVHLAGGRSVFTNANGVNNLGYWNEIYYTFEVTELADGTHRLLNTNPNDEWRRYVRVNYRHFSNAKYLDNVTGYYTASDLTDTTDLFKIYLTDGTSFITDYWGNISGLAKSLDEKAATPAKASHKAGSYKTVAAAPVVEAPAADADAEK